MNTGIQYTTEWIFIKTTNGEQHTETCRLVKALNGNMTTFYTNEDAQYLTTAEYEAAFTNTLAYMESLGWDSLPLFDDSCKTNINDCPIIPPSKYAVLPIAFVCQDSGLAILPPRLTGWKFASTFQYLINGTASGNVRLVKTFNNGSATFYTDAEISSLGEGVIYMEPYKDALNRTMQYMAYLGWLASPDINVCDVEDRAACPIRKGTLIDVVNFELAFDTEEEVFPVVLTADINGNSGQTQVTGDTKSGMVVLSSVDVNSAGDNQIVLTTSTESAFDFGVRINISYSSMETDRDENTVTYTFQVGGNDIEKMIITNNGVKTLNLDVEFYILY
jgi:hypothetical protein